ncbi:hypothetical protein [Bacillus sp. MYb209]|nr:hypothetical protein [Bacillus sp. MYb209]
MSHGSGSSGFLPPQQFYTGGWTTGGGFPYGGWASGGYYPQYSGWSING